jgi:hypothetical protein
MEVVEPLLVHVTAGVLSEPRQILTCGMVVCRDINALPSTMAASSRSLLEIVPIGLCVETREFWMAGGNCARHSMFCGGVVVFMFTQQPPMPSLEASVVPITWGVCGTTVWIGTAWCAAVSTRVIQSCSMARVSGVMRILSRRVSVRANCREEKRLLAPYREGAELRRVPRSFW